MPIVPLNRRMTSVASLAKSVVKADRELDKSEGNEIWNNVDKLPTYTEQVFSLARRTLWFAFCWNDHNFDHPHRIAKNEAKKLGINSFEEANIWIEKDNTNV